MGKGKAHSAILTLASLKTPPVPTPALQSPLGPRYRDCARASGLHQSPGWASGVPAASWPRDAGAGPRPVLNAQGGHKTLRGTAGSATPVSCRAVPGLPVPGFVDQSASFWWLKSFGLGILLFANSSSFLFHTIAAPSCHHSPYAISIIATIINPAGNKAMLTDFTASRQK